MRKILNAHRGKIKEATALLPLLFEFGLLTLKSPLKVCSFLMTLSGERLPSFFSHVVFIQVCIKRKDEAFSLGKNARGIR